MALNPPPQSRPAHPVIRRVPWIVLALVSAAVAGCARSDAPSGQAAAARTPASTPSAPVVVPVSSGQLRAASRTPGPHAVVINAWATWCRPCREEFPDLVRLENAYRDRGVRLVLLSLDFKESLPDVETFLTQHGVTDTSFIRGSSETDQAFINGLDPRWSGALPATWVLDGAGHVRSFWEGQADYVRMERAVLAALQAPIPETSPETTEARP
jgi:thiol-disulfide isomerase/thioredoxin